MKTMLPTAVAALLCGLFSIGALAATPAGVIQGTARQASAGPSYYVVNAHTPKARKIYFFNSLDRNHDGQLSRSEIPKDMHDLRIHFMQADWDGNGKLSPRELRYYENGTAPQYAGVYHALVFVVSH